MKSSHHSSSNNPKAALTNHFKKIDAAEIKAEKLSLMPSLFLQLQAAPMQLSEYFHTDHYLPYPSYSYELDAVTQIVIYLPARPITPEDFYELALVVSNPDAVFTKSIKIYSGSNEIQRDLASLKHFEYSLLAVAAKVGYVPAIEALNKYLENGDLSAQQHLNAVYIYKQDSSEEIKLSLPKKPVTPQDYFDLAQALLDNEPYKNNYVDIYYGVEIELQKKSLFDFIFNLLSDASKAGHMASRDVIIDSVMEGGIPQANKHFPHIPLKIYKNEKDQIAISLPRIFQTGNELYQLGKNILKIYKIHQDKNENLTGPLKGEYYEILDASKAVTLANIFINIAHDLATKEQLLLTEHTVRCQRNLEVAPLLTLAQKRVPATRVARELPVIMRDLMNSGITLFSLEKQTQVSQAYTVDICSDYSDESASPRSAFN